MLFYNVQIAINVDTVWCVYEVGSRRMRGFNNKRLNAGRRASSQPATVVARRVNQILLISKQNIYVLKNLWFWLKLKVFMNISVCFLLSKGAVISYLVVCYKYKVLKSGCVMEMESNWSGIYLFVFVLLYSKLTLQTPVF